MVVTPEAEGTGGFSRVKGKMQGPICTRGQEEEFASKININSSKWKKTVSAWCLGSQGSHFTETHETIQTLVANTQKNKAFLKMKPQKAFKNGQRL